MKKAVIYARVSSTIERNRQNTERQVTDLKAYAEYASLEVIEVFEEYISGGKRNDERAILQDAIEYCISNRVDILLTSELSRIGRSSFEVLETVKTLIDSKINLYLQKEQMTLHLLCWLLLLPVPKLSVKTFSSVCQVVIEITRQMVVR